MVLVFKNGVKSIQTSGYNGARTVDIMKGLEKVSKSDFQSQVNVLNH